MVLDVSEEPNSEKQILKDAKAQEKDITFKKGSGMGVKQVDMARKSQGGVSHEGEL